MPAQLLIRYICPVNTRLFFHFALTALLMLAPDPGGRLRRHSLHELGGYDQMPASLRNW